MKRTFEIIKVESGSWSTDFSIKDMDHKNSDNSMSPEAFFHHIGGLCNKGLEEIQGLRFDIILPDSMETRGFDPLELCGQTTGVSSAT